MYYSHNPGSKSQKPRRHECVALVVVGFVVVLLVFCFGVCVWGWGGVGVRWGVFICILFASIYFQFLLSDF